VRRMIDEHLYDEARNRFLRSTKAVVVAVAGVVMFAMQAVVVVYAVVH